MTRINFSGRRLKQIRESQGLNAVDLAAIMNRQYGCSNVTHVHINNWETGTRPTYDYVLSLRDALNVKLDDFAEDLEDE